MRRLPVYMLVDTSISKGEFLTFVLTNGLQVLIDTVRKNPFALENVYVSFIAYDNAVHEDLPLTPLDKLKLPHLTHHGTLRSNLSNALDFLMLRVDQDIDQNSSDHSGDWQPRLLIISEGNSLDNSITPKLAEKLKRNYFALVMVCTPQINSHLDQFLLLTDRIYTPENLAFTYSNPFLDLFSGHIIGSASEIPDDYANSNTPLSFEDLTLPAEAYISLNDGTTAEYSSAGEGAVEKSNDHLQDFHSDKITNSENSSPDTRKTKKFLDTQGKVIAWNVSAENIVEVPSGRSFTESLQKLQLPNIICGKHYECVLKLFSACNNFEQYIRIVSVHIHDNANFALHYNTERTMIYINGTAQCPGALRIRIEYEERCTTSDTRMFEVEKALHILPDQLALDNDAFRNQLLEFGQNPTLPSGICGEPYESFLDLSEILEDFNGKLMLLNGDVGPDCGIKATIKNGTIIHFQGIPSQSAQLKIKLHYSLERTTGIHREFVEFNFTDILPNILFMEWKNFTNTWRRNIIITQATCGEKIEFELTLPTNFQPHHMKLKKLGISDPGLTAIFLSNKSKIRITGIASVSGEISLMVDAELSSSDFEPMPAHFEMVALRFWDVPRENFVMLPSDSNFEHALTQLKLPRIQCGYRCNCVLAILTLYNLSQKIELVSASIVGNTDLVAEADSYGIHIKGMPQHAGKAELKILYNNTNSLETVNNCNIALKKLTIESNPSWEWLEKFAIEFPKRIDVKDISSWDYVEFEIPLLEDFPSEFITLEWVQTTDHQLFAYFSEDTHGIVVIGYPHSPGTVQLIFKFKLKFAEVQQKELQIPILHVSANPQLPWDGLPVNFTTFFQLPDLVTFDAEIDGMNIIALRQHEGKIARKRGRYTDSNFKIEYIEKNKWFIVVATEGDKSATHMRDGSHIACQAFTEIVRDKLSSCEFNKKLDDASPDECEYALRYELVQAAYKGYVRIHAKAMETGENAMEYNASLTGYILKRFTDTWIIVAIGIGDGIIELNDSCSTPTILIGADKRQENRPPEFITMDNIWIDNPLSRTHLARISDIKQIKLQTHKFPIENGEISRGAGNHVTKTPTPVLLEKQKLKNISYCDEQLWFGETPVDQTLILVSNSAKQIDTPTELDKLTKDTSQSLDAGVPDLLPSSEGSTWKSEYTYEYKSPQLSINVEETEEKNSDSSDKDSCLMTGFAVVVLIFIVAIALLILLYIGWLIWGYGKLFLTP